MFVKICGTTTEEDALLSVAMGADALGFIFAPSPRQVTTQAVHDITRRLPPEVMTVGVFRDETPQRVVDMVGRAGLRAAQLSGHERPEDVQWVRERVPSVIKAFAAGDGSIADARNYGADIVMLDAPSPGSGKVFDWQLTEGVPAGVRFLLAGGLTPDNVAEAIARTNPWGVDVATGVESSPGQKDPRKLRAFIAAAKATRRDDDSEIEADGSEPFDWQDHT